MADIDFNTFVKNVADDKPEARLALAEQLKKAGLWKGEVTSEFNAKYYAVLVKLEEKYKEEAAVDKIVGTKNPTDRYGVLISLISDPVGSGTSSGPTTSTTRYITSASQTAKLLQPIAQDLLGRKLNKAELAKYTKLINKKQQEQPTVTTSGKGFSNTRGGIDEQQFIEEQISQTAEAKTNKATDAYAIMMEELGGLR